MITVVVIARLVVFILARRMMRRRYLESRDRRMLAIRRQWYAVVGGEYYPEAPLLGNFLDGPPVVQGDRLIESKRSTP